MLILNGGGYSGAWYVLGALDNGLGAAERDIVGWSSSAVAAAIHLCKLPVERAILVSERHRRLTLDLRAVVRGYLDELLPADAATHCARLIVMQAAGLHTPHFVRFHCATTRDELIEAIAVSCDLLRLTDGYFAWQDIDACRRAGHTVHTTPIPSMLVPPTVEAAHRLYALGHKH